MLASIKNSHLKEFLHIKVFSGVKECSMAGMEEQVQTCREPNTPKFRNLKSHGLENDHQTE